MILNDDLDMEGEQADTVLVELQEAADKYEAWLLGTQEDQAEGTRLRGRVMDLKDRVRIMKK